MPDGLLTAKTIVLLENLTPTAKESIGFIQMVIEAIQNGVPSTMGALRKEP